MLSSLSTEGEFATALRERVAQARDLLESELAEADKIGRRTAQSRLAYLLAVAADHGVAIAGPVPSLSLRVSMNEMARLW